MRRFLLSMTSVVTLCSAASAADLLEPIVPVEPVPVVEPALLWSGAYIGLQVGALFGGDDNGDDITAGAGFGAGSLNRNTRVITPRTEREVIPRQVTPREVTPREVTPRKVKIRREPVDATFLCGRDKPQQKRACALVIDGVVVADELSRNQLREQIARRCNIEGKIRVPGTRGDIEGCKVETRVVIPREVTPREVTPREVTPREVIKGQRRQVIKDQDRLARRNGAVRFSGADGGDDDDLELQFGGVIGADMQVGNFVVGALADINAVTSDDGEAFHREIIVGGGGLPVGKVTERLEFTEEVNWYGTARLRAGVAVGPALLYGTGGLAFGDVERSGFYERNFDANAAELVLGNKAPRVIRRDFEDDGLDLGFVLGAGAEVLVSNNFSVGVEYRYVNFGGADFDFDNGFDGDRGDFDFHSVKLRANLRFGDLFGNDTPAVAAY